MSALTREKLAQAAEIVSRSEFDVWITFVRETGEGSDPVLPFMIEGGLTWQSALLIGRDGRKIAVVGNYDADPLIACGDWDEVIPYVQSIRGPLRDAIGRWGQNPMVGANYSTDDVKADGLTHGMYLLLEDYLAGEARLGSAASLAMELRGVKTDEEVRRMRAAIAETERIFAEVPGYALRGVSERAVYDRIQSDMAARGLGYAWAKAGNPIVNSGPNSMIGHGIPSASILIEDGHIFHIDLGVICEEYSSDIQRVWYVGDSVPDDVDRAFRAVNRAIDAGAAVLRPGVLGCEVDAAARASLVADGYPEYLHALGHQVGRVAHDGGAILGPEWERYGRTPRIPILEGEVYTLELGITVPGRGYLGLEEMVRVTKTGIEWLSQRPASVPTI